MNKEFVITIDEEFAALIPPLSKDEIEGLERSCNLDGIRDALVVWNGILIDGHNRFEIAHKYNLDYNVISKDFKARDEAIEWIILNQFSRRNLTMSSRVDLAIKLMPIYEKRAKENQVIRKGNQAGASSQNSENLEEVDTYKKASRRAGISHDSLYKGIKIKNKAPKAIKDKFDKGEISLNQAYQAVRDIEKEEHKEDLKNKASQIDLIEGFESEKTISFKHGDFIKLGNHYLYCGDNTDKAFIDFLPPAKFAFADPPYNCTTAVAEWDKDFTWCQDYLTEKAEMVAITPGTGGIFHFAANTLMPYRWSIATWITNGMTRGSLGFQNWIYTALFSKKESIFQNGQDFFKITIDISETEETSHKGRKPSQYMVTMLDWFSKENDIVIDPFLGSGTTLLTCEKLNRICYGAELSKDYCLEIISRWQSLTGKKAEVLDAVLH